MLLMDAKYKIFLFFAHNNVKCLFLILFHQNGSGMLTLTLLTEVIFSFFFQIHLSVWSLASSLICGKFLSNLLAFIFKLKCTILIIIDKKKNVSVS